jgi:beta-glucosidase-like glycosyl hydrolase
MHSDYNVSLFDFWDTYLPQYQRVFTEANAAGAMCSYVAENGRPSCTNSWLLTDVLRGAWNRSDAYITTDCGVMRNSMGPPLNLKTKEESVAAAINAGTDLEMGTDYWNSSMLPAVSKGLVKETVVDAAAYRGILQRIRQGDFDPTIPPPPPPPPRNCSAASLVPGTDTQFGTYLPGSPMPLRGVDATAEHCKALCCADQQCDAFTFATTGNVTSSACGAGSCCWLKTCGGPSKCGALSDSCSAGYHCTSGKMDGDMCEGNMTAHMDSTGSYVPGFGPLVLKGADMTPQHCQALCCQHTSCDAFTFDTGQGAAGTANCWLKSGGHLTQTADCAASSKLQCTSGQVRDSHGGGGGGGPSPASDPLNKLVEWSNIGTAVINSTAHQNVNYRAALESFVLLKNSGQLPLKSGQTIAVVGPAAVAQFGLLSDYYGDMVCFAPNETNKNKNWDCIPTIGSQIAAVNGGGKTTVAAGVSISGTDASGIGAALEAVESADVVVMVLGIDHSIEHEGVDVKNTTLPGLQESFALQVLAKKKPTVLVVVGDDCSGAASPPWRDDSHNQTSTGLTENCCVFAMPTLIHLCHGAGIDSLVGGSAAIIKAFYPSTQGARALAASLFGHENRVSSQSHPRTVHCCLESIGMYHYANLVRRLTTSSVHGIAYQHSGANCR